jgi:hypothetical protein
MGRQAACLVEVFCAALLEKVDGAAVRALLAGRELAWRPATARRQRLKDRWPAVHR